MINSKKKGNLWENKFANWLKDNGIKAWKDGMSGGGSREKADVGNNLNLHMEVKAVAGINLKKVWDKAEFECQKTHNTPLIAIHFNGMPDNKFLIVIDNDAWLDLMLKKPEEKVVMEEVEDSREKKWAIQNSITSLKKLLKFYD